MAKLWVQKWEESERGWGTRPDGYTLHSKQEDITKFITEMRAREMAGQPDGYIPDEYSRPCGNPYEVEIADEKLVGKVKKSKNGVWGPGKDPPDPPPGVNPGGWVKMR